jgi:hypothetical protein
MSLRLSDIPDDRGWKKAYVTAMMTRDDGHFYENMASAMELLGTREQELLKEASEKSTASSEFRSITEELEAINDALYLLKAYYNAQGGGYLNDMCSGAS